MHAKQSGAGASWSGGARGTRDRKGADAETRQVLFGPSIPSALSQLGLAYAKR